MHLYELHACFALISSALVCVVVHPFYRVVVSFSRFVPYISGGSTVSAESAERLWGIFMSGKESVDTAQRAATSEGYPPPPLPVLLSDIQSICTDH